MNTREMRKEVLKYKNSIITRNMYCPVCAELQMPRIHNIAIVFGQTSKRYHPFSVKKDSQVNEYGFTPHLINNIKLYNIEGEECVIFDKRCGMNGCGVGIDFSNTQKSMYDIYTLNSQFDYLLIENFYNLLHFKDKEYYVFA